MIIVEGPDGAGKTTLVEDLCQRFDFKQGVRGEKDRDHLYRSTMMDSYTAVNAAVTAFEPPVIWDRMFYSDPIYAHITRNAESVFNMWQLNHLHRLVVALTVPVIFCLPPLDVVRENVKSTDQMDGVVENIDAIYEAYHNLAHGQDWEPGQVIHYDYTIRGSVPRVATKLRTYLRYRQERSVNFP